ncbi:MAG: hypothetical protein GDA45_04180 [Chromatiales bacterium]|nr:hypothetical protein [Chromatiales bacterium]
MSEIALYNALTKLGLPPDEAKEAVADVASTKDVATKQDIKEIKHYIDTAIAKQNAKMERLFRQQMMWIVGVGLAVIGVIKYL